MTLRSRITLLTLSILALSLLVIGASLYPLLRGFLYQNLKADLDVASGQVLRSVRTSPSIPSLPPSLYAEVDVVVLSHSAPITTKDLEDSIIPIKSASLGASRLVLKPVDYYRLLDKGSVWAETSLPHGQDTPLRLLVKGVLLQLPIGFLNTSVPVVVLTAKPLGPVLSTLQGLLRIYLLTAVAVLLLASFLVDALVGRTFRPLETMSRKAEEVSLQSFTTLPESPGNDEVSTLVHSLNRMLKRLERSFQTQRRFLADASHELRTPITAVLGHVGYLLRRTQLSDAQRESMETIQREGERMKRLVTDLLDLAASEGQIPLEMRQMDLCTLLHDISEEFSHAFAGRIELDLPESAMATGDEARLHQVFSNLVANAIKASAKTVTLRVRNLEEKLVVSVEDDGPGISTEHLPHLFERFYRVDKARDRTAGGSGLGLAIVKSIVEGHGGKVWVDSEPGKGTVFNVSLKRATVQSLPRR